MGTCMHFLIINSIATHAYRFTTKHISPALQQLELQSFGKSVTVHGNMEVRVYSGVSEISVVYKVDEFSIELFVHLPMSYPLQPPAIREGKRIRIDPAQWRKWLLQFNIFVTNQVRKTLLIDSLNFKGRGELDMPPAIKHLIGYDLGGENKRAPPLPHSPKTNISNGSSCKWKRRTVPLMGNLSSSHF